MALIQCDFFSEALGLSQSMHVILPQATRAQIGMGGAVRGVRHPTLYLLHGLSDDHTIWCRRTSIERYVAELGLAVVMPNVHRSYYTDMASGGRYWEFISEELPTLARRFFPLSDVREENYAAGLSMGGFGAFKLALQHPERFAAAASLSGALDPVQSLKGRADRNEEMVRIFGEEGSVQRERADLVAASERIKAAGGVAPALFMACGTNDGLVGVNRNMAEHLDRIGYEVRYDEDAGYGHSWSPSQ